MIIATPRHAGAAVTAAIVALLVGASSTDAKVFFGGVEGRSFAWDGRFSATIANCPGNDSCRRAVEGTVVYLRRGRRTRSRPDVKSLKRVGRVSSQGTIRFRVPHVRVGRYHLLARVRTDLGPRWFPASGTFRIRRG
jgi:hypothetical protein